MTKTNFQIIYYKYVIYNLEIEKFSIIYEIKNDLEIG